MRKVDWKSIKPVTIGEATKSVHVGDYVNFGSMRSSEHVAGVYESGCLFVNEYGAPSIIPLETEVKIYCPY